MNTRATGSSVLTLTVEGDVIFTPGLKIEAVALRVPPAGVGAASPGLLGQLLVLPWLWPILLSPMAVSPKSKQFKNNGGESKGTVGWWLSSL